MQDLTDLELRLNEIKFCISIKQFLSKYPVTELKNNLQAILTLINHTNKIDVGNAWMYAMSGQIDHTFDELVILLYNKGMSKNAIRKQLGTSPNKVYEVIDNQEELNLRPRLDRRMSLAVSEFIIKLEDFMDIWIIDLGKER